MALNEIQQIKELIKKSHHILITFKKDFSPDAVASALACYLFLKKISQNSGGEWGGEKLINIISDDFILPSSLKFLPQTDLIESAGNNIQKFIITVTTNGNEIDEFSYDIKNSHLKIYVTTKKGALKPADVSAENSDYKYDLIITLGAPDLGSLGALFNNFTDFFYNTDIINIDNKPDNEHFGQINLTNLNAVSVSEILFNLFNELDKTAIDKDIATCLLTGLIAETKSFKTANVTPKTLEIAGQLLSLDGDRETIVKNLYRSRSLSTLKLWGRVLARLKTAAGNRLVWSILTEHDFIEADAEPKNLLEIFDELIAFIPAVEVAVLIYQQNGQNQVMVNAFKNCNALYLTKEFKATGSKRLAQFALAGQTLVAAESEVIKQIEAGLSQK